MNWRDHLPYAIDALLAGLALVAVVAGLLFCPDIVAFLTRRGVTLDDAINFGVVGLVLGGFTYLAWRSERP